MNLLAIGGIALAIVSAAAVGEGWVIVHQHDALIAERAATRQARADVDAVQIARGRERTNAQAAYDALSASCHDETQRAADAGRAIERASNAPVPPGGRRVLTPGELRVIAGQAQPRPGVSAQSDRPRIPNAGNP